MIGRTTVHGYGGAPVPRALGIVHGTERGFERTTDVHVRHLLGTSALAIQALIVAVTLLINRHTAGQFHAPAGSGFGTRISVMF